MRILESELRKIIKRELRESRERYLIGEAALPKMSRAEGNAFRQWVIRNYKDYATEIDLDPRGSSSNSYMRKAWAKHGDEYASQSGRAAAARAPAARPAPPARAETGDVSPKEELKMIINGEIPPSSRRGKASFSLTDKGPVIKIIQQVVGASVDSGPNGIFGDNTWKSVKAYQEKHGLREVPGVVGKLTAKKILKDMATGQVAAEPEAAEEPSADVPAQPVEKTASVFQRWGAGIGSQLFRVLPAPVAAVILHLAGVEEEVSIPSSKTKRALYYTILAKEKGLGPRGPRNQIHYGHYWHGQTLDPKYKDNPEGVYGGKWAGVPSAGGKEAIFSSNPYVQMSITFGNAGFSGDKESGYKVTDNYDFNNGREASRDIFAAADRSGAVDFIKKKTIGEDQDWVQAAEEVMKWREDVMGYSGYPLTVDTGTA